MTDERKPNLSLPESPPAAARQKHGVMGFLVITLLLAIIGLQFFYKPEAPATTTGKSDAPATDWKALALKLNQRNLHKAAAAAWRKHLETLTDRAQRGNILYQIGEQCMHAGDHEQAVSAFYRADRLLGAGAELTHAITDNISACLERLGKFDEKDRELRERVHVNADKNRAAAIAAEIGLEKIPLHELDRMIAREIELQLTWQMAAPPTMKKQLLEQYLKQYANPQQKLQKLNQIVGQQILYRRGRELNIDDDPGLREMLAQVKMQLIAQAVVTRELRDRIKPTESDLRTYFTAHQDRFVVPPKATVRLLPMSDGKAAADLLESLKTESDLLARARVDGKDTSLLVEDIAPDDPVGGLGKQPALSRAIFAQTDKGFLPKPVEVNGAWLVVYVAGMTPAQAQDFESAQSQVINQYYQEKQAEIQRAMIQDLFGKHGVLIHEDVVLGTQVKPDADKNGPTPETQKKAKEEEATQKP